MGLTDGAVAIHDPVEDPGKLLLGGRVSARLDGDLLARVGAPGFLQADELEELQRADGLPLVRQEVAVPLEGLVHALAVGDAEVGRVLVDGVAELHILRLIVAVKI